eukprot:12795177-Ditylum_brightwellii.AAC.1
MQSNEENEQVSIDKHCRTESTALGKKWRNCFNLNRTSAKRRDKVRRNKRNIATIAAFLFAWVSPRSFQVNHPPSAHADNNAAYYTDYTPAAFLKGYQVRDRITEADTKSIAKGVVVLAAVGTTGRVIGQKKKKNNNRGEEQFNQIMNNNMKA